MSGPDHDTSAGPQSIASGDLDGDKRPDIVTANRIDGSVSVLVSRCLP